MDAFTISFHRCYLLLHICFSPPPSYYSLHCVTLHYTAASRGCCNGSAAASAQLCNCSDTSSSVMNSCLFRLCCIFLTSCKGSGALLLHFPSSRSSSSSCNEWSGSTHICHLHSTLYLPLQPLPGYCSHNTLKSTLMHSLLLNTVYPSLTGGVTILHAVNDTFASAAIFLSKICWAVSMSMSINMNMNMNHQRLQIVMSRQFHTFGMFSFRVLDKIPSSVVCCLPFSGVAWLGWPPVKACNPLQGTQYFWFTKMIFSTVEQYSEQISIQRYPIHPNPIHPSKADESGLMWMNVDESGWEWMKKGENGRKWMKISMVLHASYLLKIYIDFS